MKSIKSLGNKSFLKCQSATTLFLMSCMCVGLYSGCSSSSVSEDANKDDPETAFSDTENANPEGGTDEMPDNASEGADGLDGDMTEDPTAGDAQNAAVASASPSASPAESTVGSTEPAVSAQAGAAPPDAPPAPTEPPSSAATSAPADAPTAPSSTDAAVAAAPAAPSAEGPAPAAAGSTGSGGQMSYTVQRGDTLMKIAFAVYGDVYRWREIYEANKDKIKNPNIIEPSVVLNLSSASSANLSQPSGEKYLIQSGDTLAKIAKKVYGKASKWRKIYKNNTGLIKNPDKIYSGFYLYYLPAEPGEVEPHAAEPLLAASPQSASMDTAPAPASASVEPAAAPDVAAAPEAVPPADIAPAAAAPPVVDTAAAQAPATPAPGAEVSF